MQKPQGNKLHQSRQLQYSLMGLLILTSLICVMLTIGRFESQRRIAKHRQMATELDVISNELRARMEDYLEFASSPRSPDRPTITAENLADFQRRQEELTRLQSRANALSIEIERLDASDPSWFERIQTVVTRVFVST
jgi:hypothetical protein